MLHIDITDFTLMEFLEEITYSKYSWQVNVSDHKHEGGYALRISVNKKCVINDPKKSSLLSTYVLYATLRSINNAFYKLLTGNSEAEIIIDWGSGGSQKIILKKERKKNLLTTIRTRLEFDNYLDKESIDLYQACEEAIRAISFYKDVCMEAAKIIVPIDPLHFMIELFGKEEKYTQHRYEDDSFDWNEYAQDFKKKRVERIYSPEEYDRLFHEMREENSFNDVLIIRDYYEWLPLETAWEEFKKNNIG
mgnify:CR=1 FL=1